MLAWQFDRAVHLFGSTVDGELREAREGAKNNSQARNRQQAVLARYLNVERKFRDPAAGSSSSTTTAGPGDIVSL